jgi:hypothetical protein
VSVIPLNATVAPKASPLLSAALLLLAAWDRDTGRACLTVDVERLRSAVAGELEGCS